MMLFSILTRIRDKLLISQPYPPLTLEQQVRLLRVAREAIYYYASHSGGPSLDEDDERLKESQGVFVSLHIDDRLRGCIGSMTGDGPLFRAVADMAVSAANNDPRFAPMRMDEIPRLDIELSVLGPMQEVTAKDVEVGEHGLLVSQGRMRGTLLPQVATQYGWTREQFLSQTCIKAGLAENAWQDDDCSIAVFTAQVFSESDIRSEA